MQSIHEALQVIARGAKMSSLELNAAGFAELVFGDGLLTLWISNPEESQLEISARIDAFDRGVTPALARELLIENATRPFGRFSLEMPETVLFGIRLEVASLDAEALIAALERFARAVLQIEAHEAQAIWTRAERHITATEMPAEAMIRL